MHRTALTAMHGARTRMQQIQDVALTGQRVARPSDDPVAAARAGVLSTLTESSITHQSNAEQGILRLQSAEEALADIGNQLSRAKEIAIGMSNGAVEFGQRQAAAAEVQQVVNSVIDRINSRHLGEYVFAHVNTTSPPYDGPTRSFTYNVDVFDTVRVAEIGPSQTAEIGSSASVAFAQRVADPASVDVVDILDTLQFNLETDNVAGIRADIDSIEAAFEQVLAERANTGVRTQRLREAENAAEQAMSVYTNLRSDLVDADAGEAFSNLTLAETTMQAAVAVAARILGPSLLDAL